MTKSLPARLKNRPLIQFYYDIVSPYSFIGFELLNRLREKELAHVDVDFVPFYLGGIMAVCFTVIQKTRK
jgi:2-hydroxychromene-2-carboxylate isomerase